MNLLRGHRSDAYNLDKLNSYLLMSGRLARWSDKKERFSVSSAARSSTTLSMSMLSTSCKHKGKTWKTSVSMVNHLFAAAAAASPGCVFCPGWIIQPQQPSFDGPEWIRLYQWVAERLEVARNLECVANIFSLMSDMKHYNPLSGT